MENNYPFIDFDIGTSEYVLFFGNGSSVTIKEKEEILIDQANEAVRDLRHESIEAEHTAFVKKRLLQVLGFPENFSWEAIYDGIKNLKENQR